MFQRSEDLSFFFPMLSIESASKIDPMNFAMIGAPIVKQILEQFPQQCRPKAQKFTQLSAKESCT